MRSPKAAVSLAALVVLAIACIPAIAFGQATVDYESPRLEEELEFDERVRVEALSAAFKHARSVEFDTKGKVVIISQKGRQLVVRFEPQQARVRDGTAQFTYDPDKGAIVEVKVDG